MNEINDQSIQDFLDQLASKKPTPGGGSVAAIMGANAAGLIGMVCNLTIGKSQYEEVEDEMRALLQKSEALRSQFVDLINKDIEAFEQVMAAYRLPKASRGEQKIRSETIQEALKKATNVPSSCIRYCAEIIQLSRAAAEKANKNVITDVGVAAEAARAALKSSTLNVYVNIAGIKDQSFVNETVTELEEIFEESEIAAEEIYQSVKEQL